MVVFGNNYQKGEGSPDKIPTHDEDLHPKCKISRNYQYYNGSQIKDGGPEIVTYSQIQLFLTECSLSCALTLTLVAQLFPNHLGIKKKYIFQAPTGGTLGHLVPA